MSADQPVGKQDQISRADFSDAAVRPAARRAEPARRHANFFRHIIHSLDESSFAAVDAYGKNRCRVIPRNGDQSFEEFIDRHLFRSEEHTSELQSLMRISYAVFCLKKKNHKNATIRRYDEQSRLYR